MLSRIFPKQIDNIYRGYWLAVWLLLPIVVVKMIMGFNMLLNAHELAQTADRLPLDSFGALPAAIIVMDFKTGGLERIVLATLALVALLRYRAMLPLIYLLLAFDAVGLIVLWKIDPLPVVRSSGGPSVGFMINLVLAAALLIGLALSLGKTDKGAMAV
jgi:hypothetical protein